MNEKPIRPNIPGELRKAITIAVALSDGTLADYATDAIRARLQTDALREGWESLALVLKADAEPDFDPERVPGSLLIEFSAKGWPEGWCWQDEGLWGEEGDLVEDPEGRVEPLDSDRIYDITEYYLDPDGPGQGEPLETFVRDFLAKEGK